MVILTRSISRKLHSCAAGYDRTYFNAHPTIWQRTGPQATESTWMLRVERTRSPSAEFNTGITTPNGGLTG